MPAVRVPNRWFGVGHSTTPDAAAACAEATAGAIEGRDPAVLFVFSSLGHADLPAVAEAARTSVGPGTAIVGGTTFGEIAPKGASTKGVVAMALGGDGITVRTALSREARGRQRAAGMEVAREVGRTGRQHEVLLMVPDGALGRQHEVIRGAYAVVGARTPMAGGCTAGELFNQTYQFYGDHSGVEILSGSVVCVLVGSDGPIGVGVAHGWRPYGEPLSLTSVDESRILQFDHQPALDVYLRRMGADPSLADDFAALAELSLRYPLGLARRTGQDIRIVYSMDPVERSITCFADVSQGALAWLMKTDQEALIGSGRQSCEEAISALDGAPPLGLMVFNCGVRMKMLKDGVSEEVAGMVDAADGAPVAGFYSMGEIARMRGTRGMHHLTSVSLAFG